MSDLAGVGANHKWVPGLLAGRAGVESVSWGGNHGRGAARPYPGAEGQAGAFFVRGPLPFEVVWVSCCLTCVDKQGFGDLFTCGTWRCESEVPCPLRWILRGCAAVGWVSTGLWRCGHVSRGGK